MLVILIFSKVSIFVAVVPAKYFRTTKIESISPSSSVKLPATVIILPLTTISGLMDSILTCGTVVNLSLLQLITIKRKTTSRG